MSAPLRSAVGNNGADYSWGERHDTVTTQPSAVTVTASNAPTTTITSTIPTLAGPGVPLVELLASKVPTTTTTITIPTTAETETPPGKPDKFYEEM